MALSSTLRAALKKTGGGACYVLHLAHPDGATTLRYAATALETSDRKYDPRVTRRGWGGLARRLSDRGGSIPAPELRVSLTDIDGTLLESLEGRYRRQWRGAVATVLLAHADVAVADWATRFVGVLDRWEVPGPYLVQLILRADDRPLRSRLPHAVIDRATWPNALAELYAQPAPLIYGRHDSTGTTGTGAVPLLKVDTSLLRYLVCAGAVKSVDAVYVAGAVQTLTTHYTVATETHNGRYYTVVTFVSDPGDAAVTADVQGYEATGDGSGALITDPAEQIQHLLVNFVYNDYQRGDWLATTGVPINTTAVTAATAFAARTTPAYAGARRVSEFVRGADLLADWLRSFGMYASWQADGQLLIGYEDHATLAEYTALHVTQEDVSALRPYADSSAVAGTLRGRALYDEAQGDYLEQLTVVDTLLDVDEEEVLDMPASAANAS